MRKRSTTADCRPFATTAKAAVQKAAPSALPAIRYGALSRSGRLRAADVSAPTTNPSCTAVVSSGTCTPLSPHSARSAGAAAEAANQVASASTWADATSASCRMADDPPPGPASSVGGGAVGSRGVKARPFVSPTSMGRRSGRDNPVAARQNADMDILDRARELGPGLVELRRELHRAPELDRQLPKTQALILAALDGLDLEIVEGTALSSVTAVVRGGAHDGSGPVVLLRGDMDALPVHEETGLPYASEHDGLMHACGHDLHVAVPGRSCPAAARGS